MYLHWCESCILQRRPSHRWGQTPYFTCNSNTAQLSRIGPACSGLYGSGTQFCTVKWLLTECRAGKAMVGVGREWNWVERAWIWVDSCRSGHFLWQQQILSPLFKPPHLLCLLGFGLEKLGKSWNASNSPTVSVKATFYWSVLQSRHHQMPVCGLDPAPARSIHRMNSSTHSTRDTCEDPDYSLQGSLPPVTSAWNSQHMSCWDSRPQKQLAAVPGNCSWNLCKHIW